MAIVLKANEVNLFVSSVLFVFWYHSPNIVDTPRMLPLRAQRNNKQPLPLLVIVCVCSLLPSTAEHRYIP
jgi:hypothetical protein